MSLPGPGDPPCRFYAAPHWPQVYRYLVANPGVRVKANRYSGQFGSALIGFAVVVGRYAYSVKWADAKTDLR